MLFAHKTATQLAYHLATAVPDELTPMERAQIRHHYLTKMSKDEQYYQHYMAVPRLAIAWWLQPRLPMREVKTVKVERSLCYCPNCNGSGLSSELPWAIVDGQLDGGPECPKCSQPYWEAWRRVLHQIAEYAVGECRRKAEAMRLMAGSPYSVDQILLGGVRLIWNPGRFSW